MLFRSKKPPRGVNKVGRQLQAAYNAGQMGAAGAINLSSTGLLFKVKVTVSYECCQCPKKKWIWVKQPDLGPEYVNSDNDINGDWGTSPELSAGIIAAIRDKIKEMMKTATKNCKGEE